MNMETKLRDDGNKFGKGIIFKIHHIQIWSTGNLMKNSVQKADIIKSPSINWSITITWVLTETNHAIVKAI